MKDARFDGQRLSALLEGRLEGAQRDELLAYLALADEDYFVVVDTASILHELEEQEAKAHTVLPMAVRRAKWPSAVFGGIGYSAPRVHKKKETKDGGLADTHAWKALLRGDTVKYQIAEFAGGLLFRPTVAELLQISGFNVATLIQRHELLTVPLPGGEPGFPALQFTKGRRIRSGVPEVAKTGAHVDAWILLSILVDDVEDGAGGTLLERLDEWMVLEDVLNRLATYGEHLAG